MLLGRTKLWERSSKIAQRSLSGVSVHGDLVFLCDGSLVSSLPPAAAAAPPSLHGHGGKANKEIPGCDSLPGYKYFTANDTKFPRADDKRDRIPRIRIALDLFVWITVISTITHGGDRLSWIDNDRHSAVDSPPTMTVEVLGHCLCSCVSQTNWVTQKESFANPHSLSVFIAEWLTIILATTWINGGSSEGVINGIYPKSYTTSVSWKVKESQWSRSTEDQVITRV